MLAVWQEKANKEYLFMKKMNNKTIQRVGKGALILLLALFALSCATKSDAYKDIDNALAQNNYAVALAAVKMGQEQKKPLYPEKNAVLLYLDKGMLELYAGDTESSSKDLQEAERLIEEAYTKSVSAELTSYIANDNTKEYAGEDFEDIYINVFNALNYYKRGDIDGALVEIRKLSNSSGKLDMLSRKYEEASKGFGDKAMESLKKLGFNLSSALPQGEAVNFSNSALARYLAALFLLGEGNTDGARIELEQLTRAFAANTKLYSFPVPKTVAEDRTVPAGKARLNVVAFAGLSPVKEEGKFTQNWPFMKNAPLRSPVFKLPVFKDRPSAISSIEVTAGDEKFTLEIIEDMGAVVKETFAARFSNLFFKTYIRVLLKYAAADIAASQVKNSAQANLIAFAAAKSLDATEAADIRMSRYMPNKAYVGGINLDPGTYDVTVNFIGSGGSIATVKRNVEVKAGALNLVDAISLK